MSADVEAVYPQVFRILLQDEKESIEIACSPEVEPVIREVVEAYRAQPTSHDRRFTVKTLVGETLQFMARDVMTYSLCHTSTSEWGVLTPVNVKMFGLWFGTEPTLFYEVAEEHILGVLHEIRE